MKKILSILLALLMLCSVALTACDLENTASSTNSTQSSNNSSNGGNGGGSGDGDNKTPEIPSQPSAGYSFKIVGDLRFEYPSNWEDLSNAESIYLHNPDAFSHIIVEIGEAASFWTELTPQDFESEEPPTNGAHIETFVCRENQHSISVNIATCTLNATDAKMFVLATTINNVSYAIKLNVNEKEFSLAETIFNSIVNLNPPEGEGDKTPDANAPAGYKPFTNYNLRFAYPDAWTTDSSANSRDVVINGGSNFRLYLHSSPKTTMFDGLTDDTFRDTYVENLETQYGGTIDSATVEYRENDNGLLVAIIMFSITTENAIEGEIWYCVTIDETTHCLILRTAVEDETLFQTIFNSLTATDGPNVSNGSESNPGTSTKPEGSDPGTSTKPEGSDPGTSTNPSNKEQEIYQEAKDFYKEGDYEKAYALFSQIPDYPGVDKYLDELEEKLGLNGSQNKPETSDPSISEKEAEEIYQTATNLFAQGEYRAAYRLFAQIPDYSDAKTYIQKLEQILKI